MQIIIKTKIGKIIVIEIELIDTISIVKAKIQDKENIPIDQQILFFDKKQLEDNKTLADYSIHQESILCLIIKSNIFMKLFTDIVTVVSTCKCNDNDNDNNNNN
jgi:hypothetical protein